MESPQQDMGRTITPYRTRLLTALCLVIVSIAYLVQIATPLRLINDGVDYLLQASSALDGNGFRVHGVQSMRPAGYPALIFVLVKLGVGKSWGIVALNCLLLGLGCWASYFVMSDSFGFSPEVSQIISLLTLLSFVMVRNVTYPLSDVCFFGISLACLLVLVRAEADPWPRRMWRLILVVPLILLCIKVRTIGIALIPALIWAAIGGVAGARDIYPVLRRHRFVILAILVVVLVVGTRLLLDSAYMQFNMPTFHRRGLVGTITSNTAYHTTEWGEMTLNAPVSKLPAVLLLPLRIVGALAIFVFVIGIWQQRRSPNAVLLYVIGFACIVFAYPWSDSRLWLPVLPFLAGYVLMGLERMVSNSILRPLLVVYCLCFCLLGSVALGFSTRITFSGARFPDIYGDGNFRDTYKFVLRGESPTNGHSIDPDALYLLRRYECRAARK